MTFGGTGFEFLDVGITEVWAKACHCFKCGCFFKSVKHFRNYNVFLALQLSTISYLCVTKFPSKSRICGCNMTKCKKLTQYGYLHKSLYVLSSVFILKIQFLSKYLMNVTFLFFEGQNNV